MKGLGWNMDETKASTSNPEIWNRLQNVGHMDCLMKAGHQILFVYTQRKDMPELKEILDKLNEAMKKLGQ